MDPHKKQMSKFEFERVYVKTEDTFVCKSEGEFRFVGWKNKKGIITSSKVAIPEIQSNWWIELKTNTPSRSLGNNNASNTLDVKLQSDDHLKKTYFNRLQYVGAPIVTSQNQNPGADASATKPIVQTSNIDSNHVTVSLNASCDIKLSAENPNNKLTMIRNPVDLKRQNLHGLNVWSSPFAEQNLLDSTVRRQPFGRNEYQQYLPFPDNVEDNDNNSLIVIQVSISIFRSGSVHENEVFRSIESPIPMSWIFQSENVNRAYNDDSLKDFTFIVEDKVFRVHKLVLSLASDAFRAMFTSGLNETKTACATVKECQPEIFEHLLQFIYNGKLPKNLPSIAVDLYKIAHLYQIEKLQEICIGYVLRDSNINKENALNYYTFAMEFDMEKLFLKSWEFIRTTMLDIHVPCAPKKVEEIRALLDMKSKYQSELRKFVG